MEERITKLENEYREIRQSQDDILVMHDSTNRKLDLIYTCLLGNEIENEGGNGHGGGVVKRLSRNEERVDRITSWMTGVKARNKVVWSFIALIMGSVITLIIKAWDKLIS
jgi:hypothetical protein